MPLWLRHGQATQPAQKPSPSTPAAPAEKPAPADADATQRPSGPAAHQREEPRPQATAPQFNVGRGIADITSEPAEVGFMGYGDGRQKGQGVHMRQFARAFAVQDARTGRKQVVVVADMLAVFDSVRQGVLERLRARLGAQYGEANVLLTATHTHSATGGYSWHNLYNVTTNGYHPKSYNAVVGGIVESIVRADRDLAPGEVTFSRSELRGASVNRSREAFEKNRADLKRRLPNGVDPSSVTMRFEREGRTDALLNWFSVHGTSLPTENRLLSTDNKGYAEYLTERGRRGVDYLASGRPSMVAAFSSGAAGDASPNLWLRPGQGPTSDSFENMRILGTRQADAVEQQLSAPGTPLTQGGIDSRITYVNMNGAVVRPEYSGTGRSERTCAGALGGPFGAGSTEDGGGGLPVFAEGAGKNPLASFLSSYLHVANPKLVACQKNKQILLATGDMKWSQTNVPIQVMRIGDRYVVGLPSEVTAASALVVKDAVADRIGVSADNVIIQGLSNAYAHYVTTPEEYSAQHYEGGATLFGRHQLAAYAQTAADLAAAMKGGRSVPLGQKPVNRSRAMGESLSGKVLYDLPTHGRYGKELRRPAASVARGQLVSAQFSGAHPNNDLRTGASYMFVERQERGRWVKVADDTDFATRFVWTRFLAARSKVDLQWTVPADARPGVYRFRYEGAARDGAGRISPIRGTSSHFVVR
ncbi:neutral/alkaline non-lysosomal ceramidase N-terminal domain-containing protein [Falsarthrobacter nasiphocae]|uniref:Neutral ceramidase n=1 Tax=Falsarthrobacter nasiphocae TaxID=189863 RepID=A0AAE4C8K5_9MICC|nr:neutral/alkaline non-lysosomal ceramidase N-terminal domain-containing protein [Falsarthrobacter nasiphocae]MDR6892510.1 neutral ceramidase [Falsarthrobacter nasiphocae]